MSFDLAAHIRQLREELGWTQEDLAKRAHIDQADLSRIERGGIDPRWSTVNKIINALGETFELTTAPTTLRPALTAETRKSVRRTAQAAAPRRRTPGEALPIKR
jgi:predicted transcriptional regulator